MKRTDRVRVRALGFRAAAPDLPKGDAVSAPLARLWAAPREFRNDAV